MKTFSATIQQNRRTQSFTTGKLIPVLASNMRNIMALMYAGLAAAAVMTLSIWVAGMGINTLLGVSTWAMGFVFLAVAVDNRGRLALLQMTSGVALLTISLLQNSISPDFFLLTGVLSATWVAFAVFKRLCHQVL
jgi:hypothetical protein